MYTTTKEAVDMSPAEYRKFIFQSGVDRPAGWERKIITLNATGSGLDSDGELKQVIDMSSKEYAKYIAQSGVQDTHGGGRIITMNAEGDKDKWLGVHKSIWAGMFAGTLVGGVIGFSVKEGKYIFPILGVGLVAGLAFGNAMKK